MNSLLERISLYNIFNYLLPGVLFAAIGTSISAFQFLADDIVIAAFLCYLYGLVISRIGSLLLEPLLRLLDSNHHVSYEEFITPVRINSKVETLLEQANTYRSLAAMFLCLLILVPIEKLLGFSPTLAAYAPFGGLLLLSALFIWSYRKQSGYVAARAKAVLNAHSISETVDRSTGDNNYHS